MKARELKTVLVIIIATVIITLTTQVYRNIQIYELNKERFIKDVRLGLDVGLENFYAFRAKIDIAKAYNEDSSNVGVFWMNKIVTSDNLDTAVQHTVNISHDSLDDILNTNSKRTIISYKSIQQDSILPNIKRTFSSSINLDGEDSIMHLKAFANKIMISLIRSDIDFENVKQFIDEELERKNLDVEYALVRLHQDSIIHSTDSIDYPLSAESTITYLPKGEAIEIKFANSALTILRNGMVDLLISFMISAVVIGALIYLYKVIKSQKELSEIKNDLINNITHEFKTPIATTLTAIEGISNFNEMNDPVKTRKYLDISKSQLIKLDGMVEKLLITASIDSNALEIDRERFEMLEFTEKIVANYKLHETEKQISLRVPDDKIFLYVDPFHFENVISNVLENAIKYGGDSIEVEMTTSAKSIIWNISDNGPGISKDDQARIFDKFYRVPSGNVHNVKGHGIGLYYAKTLLDKHNGTITVSRKDNRTIFSIQVPKDEE